MAPEQHDSTPHRVADGLAKLALVFRHQAWQQTARTGLTPTQAQILAVVLGSPQPLGLSAIAQRLAVTTPTASEAVSTLVNKRLLKKTTSPDDARAIVLSLTAAGQREARAAGQWPDAILDAAASLPEADQGALVRGLVAMIRNLHEQGHVPTARMCVECRYFQPNAHADGPKPHHCRYIDAPIADTDLRLDCAEMQPAAASQREQLWQLFIEGRAVTNHGTGNKRGPTKSRNTHPHTKRKAQ